MKTGCGHINPFIMEQTLDTVRSYRVKRIKAQKRTSQHEWHDFNMRYEAEKI